MFFTLAEQRHNEDKQRHENAEREKREKANAESKAALEARRARTSRYEAPCHSASWLMENLKNEEAQQVRLANNAVKAIAELSAEMATAESAAALGGLGLTPKKGTGLNSAQLAEKRKKLASWQASLEKLKPRIAAARKAVEKAETEYTDAVEARQKHLGY